MPRRPRRIARPAHVLRWLAAAVVCAIAVAYVQPIRAYLDAREDVAERRAEKRALVRRQAALERRLELAGGEAFVEREARRLGLVRPGERLFVVKGVERWKRAHVR
jgi:cell division protein FtsB